MAENILDIREKLKLKRRKDKGQLIETVQDALNQYQEKEKFTASIYKKIKGNVDKILSRTKLPGFPQGIHDISYWLIIDVRLTGGFKSYREKQVNNLSDFDRQRAKWLLTKIDKIVKISKDGIKILEDFIKNWKASPEYNAVRSARSDIYLIGRDIESLLRFKEYYRSIL